MDEVLKSLSRAAQCHSAVYLLMICKPGGLSLTLQFLVLWGSPHVPPGYSSKLHCEDFIASKGFRILSLERPQDGHLE